MKQSTHHDIYEDDGIIFFASDYEKEKLEFRVGPVFNGDIPHPEMAIWITYDEGKQFLMSQETWLALSDHIYRRIEEWKRFKDILSRRNV